MKMIETFVRPHVLDTVRTALQELGIEGMTVTAVTGCGRPEETIETYRGGAYAIDLGPRLKIEVALPDELVEPAMDAIMNVARTWKAGDGKIFVTSLDEVVRIRTGESGAQAL